MSFSSYKIIGFNLFIKFGIFHYMAFASVIVGLLTSTINLSIIVFIILCLLNLYIKYIIYKILINILDIF